MTRNTRIVNASSFGGHGLRLIGTTDIDGQGTNHEIADVDPIVLFDYGKINTAVELPFRPHPHLGLTAMSFLPEKGTWMAWDSLNGESDACLQPGGLYYVHAGSAAFHHEYPSPQTVAAAMDVEFVQLVWNATDETIVKTVIIQPEQIPVVEQNGASIRVLAGASFGVESVQPFTHRKILYCYVQLEGGKSIDIPIPQSFRGILFAMEGALAVNDQRLDEHQMLILGDDDSLSVSNTESDSMSRFIVAAGEPLNKPFRKLLGLGGFIIGESDEEVRRRMDEFTSQAEQIKKEIPHHFPAQYL